MLALSSKAYAEVVEFSIWHCIVTYLITRANRPARFASHFWTTWTHWPACVWHLPVAMWSSSTAIFTCSWPVQFSCSSHLCTLYSLYPSRLESSKASHIGNAWSVVLLSAYLRVIRSILTTKTSQTSRRWAKSSKTVETETKKTSIKTLTKQVLCSNEATRPQPLHLHTSKSKHWFCFWS
jgi:hypothetical protein